MGSEAFFNNIMAGFGLEGFFCFRIRHRCHPLLTPIIESLLETEKV